MQSESGYRPWLRIIKGEGGEGDSLGGTFARFGWDGGGSLQAVQNAHTC